MMFIKSLMFSFGFLSLIELIEGEQRGIKRSGNVDSVTMSIINGNPKIIDAPKQIRCVNHFLIHR